MTASAEPVVISYKILLEDDLTPLYDAITQGFGSEADCLGLIILKDLPEEYLQLRENGLRAAAQFASLGEETKEKYTDPKSSFSFGWSHGKEVMNGVPDILKGSYYFNPTSDKPQVSQTMIKEHPSYLRDNVWPTEGDCPGFEQHVKALAKFMTETACLLAKACDKLVSQYSETPSVEKMITTSNCSKARLLHYYPPANQTIMLEVSQKTGEDSLTTKADSWCGDHLDHSLLTALCPAMYLFHPKGKAGLQPIPVPAPTASAGLFIRTRAGKELQAKIPADCMAFQTGEALQLLTRNQLKATPHYVAAGTEGPILPSVISTIDKKRREDIAWKDVHEGVISRETMAVFLQPDVDAVIGADGETFGQFTKRILESHYEGGDK